MTNVELLNCDCVEFLKNVNCKFDMILTDPPYGMSFKSNRTKNHDYIRNDSFSEWENNLSIWFQMFSDKIKDNGIVAIFSRGGGDIPLTPILTLKAIKYFNLIDTLVWKKQMGLGWRYRKSYENILILSKDKKNYKFYDNSHKVTNVLEFNSEPPRNGEHPTKKPVKLLEKLIDIHTLEGDSVLDPFMGTGNCGVACINKNRNFCGIEIEEKYYKKAFEKLKDYTVKANIDKQNDF